MLFDTHAHYDDDQFDPDREALLASLPERGVGLVVNPGCTVASSRTAVELAHRFPHIYAAVGIHPENCGDFRPEHLTEIRALAQEDKVVAIGGSGLVPVLQRGSYLQKRPQGPGGHPGRPHGAADD